ncbi:MAG TPA: glycoside hydrolase family protein [Rhodocyclaceae bacterium]|nr:glycoside hydrolase family protein [Rhodocyclaceae bacterium]
MSTPNQARLLGALCPPLLAIMLVLGGCGGGGGGGNGGSDPLPAAASSSSSTSSSPGASSSSSTGSSSASSGSSSSSSGSTTSKSAKRGIAYDLATAEDMAALSPGVSWWYNWSAQPSSKLPSDYRARYAMDFIPMLWNGNFDAAKVEAFLLANPHIKYLLVMNEPNLSDQANLTPTQAAAVWPSYEALAAKTGVKIVGPAITWGTMSGYSDPVVWLDAFYAAYRAANAQRDPQIDYLALHWYDYGLAAQLDRLKKYGKPFWVTEFANWHTGDGSAQIDSVAKQKTQMQDMVAICESRADVFRYAWFTGRWSNDTHYTSLLAANGQLTELGQYYLSLPH